MFDGMGVLHATGNFGYAPNADAVQETVLSTSGISADTNADGPVVNMIPKEGGNSFSGGASGLYTGTSLQSSNLTDELRARGLTTVTSVKYVFDAGGTIGGPIQRDRLWFFYSHRDWGNERVAASKYYNLTQSTPFYTPDFSRPAVGHEFYESNATRVTWKASERNKLNFFADPQRDCHCPANVANGSLNAPEAFFSYQLQGGLYQATWNAPMTNKLLLEAGIGYARSNYPCTSDAKGNVLPTDISIFDQSIGIQYNALTTYSSVNHPPRASQRASVSYVTGTHAFKGGVQLEELANDRTHGSPRQRELHVQQSGAGQHHAVCDPVFHQEQGQRFRVLRAGSVDHQAPDPQLRSAVSYFRGSIPAQQSDATPNGWVPARDFAARERRAFVEGLGSAVGRRVRPVRRRQDRGQGGDRSLCRPRTARASPPASIRSRPPSTTSIARGPTPTGTTSRTATWRFGPSNGECGAVANPNFGGTTPNTTYADDAIRGYGRRGYNWDFTTEVQHELRPGWSITGGYYRNWFGNFLVTDNTLVTPADYDPSCVTAPTDSRLPGGGGYQVCGLYDIKPGKFGQVNSVVTQSDNFGKQRLVNDYFSVSLNARLGADLQFGGGVDTGRTVNDLCFNVDSPGAAAGNLPAIYSAFGPAVQLPGAAITINGQGSCRYVTPFSAQTQVKAFGTYTLPRDFVVSVILQNTSGQPVVASYSAPNAIIAPSLGRDLSGGARTATVPLIVPQTMFEDRFNRLDLRLGKRFKVTEKVRLQANANFYNLLNGSAVLALNTTYGPQWLVPSAIQDGRMVQFSASLTF